MPVGRLVSRYGPSIAEGLSTAGRRAFNFSGMGKTGGIAAGVYFGYKGIKGFTDQVVPNTINNAMDVAFGDPNADNMVLGTDLTPSLIYGGSGLPGAGYARAMNPTRFGVGAKSGPIKNTVRPAIFGGVMGGLAGAGAVAGAARLAGVPVNPAKLMKAGAKKAAIGAAIGGTIGLAGTISGTVMTAKANEQILSQSPFYNQSLLTAERLNASGNIVLGMHNQRRG